MSDIPTPRYSMGQTVYCAVINNVRKSHACPDCLGSGKWAVTSPSGSQFTMSCLRCSERYRTTNVPSLEYFEKAASSRRLTIGKIDITTQPYSGDCPVKYMCVETGVGGGSVYNERNLFATEELAMESAAREVATANLEKESEPERLEQQNFSGVTLERAEMLATESDLWNAWWAYRRLKEEIAEALEGLDETLREPFIDLLRWENEHRERPSLGALLDAVDAAIDGDLTALTAVRAKFPQCFVDIAKNLKAA